MLLTAVEVGFNDTAYFRKYFKEKYRMSAIEISGESIKSNTISLWKVISLDNILTPRNLCR